MYKSVFFVFYTNLFFSCNFLFDTTSSLFCRHNDIPYQIRIKYKNRLENLTFDKNLKNESTWHTDIPRLRQGKVGSQVGKEIKSWTILQCYQRHQLLITGTVKTIETATIHKQPFLHYNQNETCRIWIKQCR